MKDKDRRFDKPHCEDNLRMKPEIFNSWTGKHYKSEEEAEEDRRKDEKAMVDFCQFLGMALVAALSSIFAGFMFFR